MKMLYDKMITRELANEAESERFAVQLAQTIVFPLILTFSGEIGTGKTTIIRTLIRTLGISSVIKSPTFSLVESYTLNKEQIHHFDLYRLNHEEELEYLGFRDYFSKHSMCCIEWPEHAGRALPNVDIRFNLSIKGVGRELQMQAMSAAGKKIIACLAGES